MGRRTGKARSIQAHFREGLEAALRADPRLLAECEPKTGAGTVVRSLVLEAGQGKTPALKLMLQMLGFKESEAADSESDESYFEPEWDWNAERRWVTERRREKPRPEADARKAERAEAEAAQQSLREKLVGLREADLEEQERRTKLAGSTALSGSFATGPPAPGMP